MSKIKLWENTSFDKIIAVYNDGSEEEIGYINDAGEKIYYGSTSTTTPPKKFRSDWNNRQYDAYKQRNNNAQNNNGRSPDFASLLNFQNHKVIGGVSDLMRQSQQRQQANDKKILKGVVDREYLLQRQDQMLRDARRLYVLDFGLNSLLSTTSGNNPIYNIALQTGPLINGLQQPKIVVGSTMLAKGILEVKAVESISVISGKEYSDVNTKNTIREFYITTGIATARISPDPQIPTIYDTLQQLNTTISITYDQKGNVVSQKVLSNEKNVKFNPQLNSALFKSVAYLENYRNLNGKQFNQAIIDESKKLKYSIKAGTSSLGGRFPIALPLLFGESLSMEQFDKVVRNLILNENSTIYLHPSIYGATNTLMQGKSYRNEPEEWVKKLQQILYDYTIGIFDKIFGD